MLKDSPVIYMKKIKVFQRFEDMREYLELIPDISFIYAKELGKSRWFLLPGGIESDQYLRETFHPLKIKSWKRIVFIWWHLQPQLDGLLEYQLNFIHYEKEI